MPITYTNDSATISTTEYSLPAKQAGPTSQTTVGVFQFFIDLANMDAGDQYQIRIYEKYDANGSQRLMEEWIVTGAQSKPLFPTPSFMLGEGWDITMKKLAGTDRTIYWSIRRVS